MARKKLASLDKMIIKSYKSANEKVIFKADDAPLYNVVPTDSAGLNYTLGNGGIVLGKIYLVKSGLESAGKTALCLFMGSAIQKNIASGKKYDDDGDLITEGNIALIDAEYSYSKVWVEKLGVDTSSERFRVVQPANGETGLQIVEDLVDSGLYDGIIIDSLNALVPEAMLENDMGDATMGVQAKMISKSYMRLIGKANEKQCTLFFISQSRSTMSKYEKDSLGGGRSSLFYPHVRLDVRRTEFLGKKEEPTGIKSKIKAEKNKLSIPYRTCEVDLYYASGYSFVSDYVDFAVKLDVIVRGGAWYTNSEGEKFNGKDKVVDYYSLEENKEKYLELVKLVDKYNLRKDYIERGIDKSFPELFKDDKIETKIELDKEEPVE